MRVSKSVCVACGHKIDAAAKLCPYCGADPKTGAKVDTQALLQEAFHLDAPKTRFSIVEFARQRQGIVIALVAVVALAMLAGLHQLVAARNANAVSSDPAVPLSEITDFGAQPNDAAQLPMPSMTFQYDGNPATMRTFLVEPGAVTPPDVLAAQQAASQATQQAAAQKGINGARATALPPNATPRPNSAAPTPHPRKPH
jgi:zinc-ribbon domain